MSRISRATAEAKFDCSMCRVIIFGVLCSLRKSREWGFIYCFELTSSSSFEERRRNGDLICVQRKNSFFISNEKLLLQRLENYSSKGEVGFYLHKSRISLYGFQEVSLQVRMFIGKRMKKIQRRVLTT